MAAPSSSPCRRPIAIEPPRRARARRPRTRSPSFARALADGAAILETDVHLTRDARAGAAPRRRRRARDRRQRPRRATRRSREVQRARRRLPASPRPTAARRSAARGLRIPTLAEALAALPGMRFNLELKEDAPEIVERVLARDPRRPDASCTLVTAGERRADGASCARRCAKSGCARRARREHRRRRAASCARRATATRRRAGPMALQIPPTFAGRPLVTPRARRRAPTRTALTCTSGRSTSRARCGPARARRRRHRDLRLPARAWCARAAVSRRERRLAARARASRPRCATARALGPVRRSRVRARAQRARDRGARHPRARRRPQTPALAELLRRSRAQRKLPIRAVRADLESAPALPLRARPLRRAGRLSLPAPAACARALRRCSHRAGWLIYETFTVHQRSSASGP